MKPYRILATFCCLAILAIFTLGAGRKISDYTETLAPVDAWLYEIAAPGVTNYKVTFGTMATNIIARVPGGGGSATNAQPPSATLTNLANNPYKGYTNGGLAGPISSVQFNSNGVMQGSSRLLFTNGALRFSAPTTNLFSMFTRRYDWDTDLDIPDNVLHWGYNISEETTGVIADDFGRKVNTNDVAFQFDLENHAYTETGGPHYSEMNLDWWSTGATSNTYRRMMSALMNRETMENYWEHRGSTFDWKNSTGSRIIAQLKDFGALYLGGGTSGDDATLVVRSGGAGTTAHNQQLILGNYGTYHNGLIGSSSGSPLSDTNAWGIFGGPNTYISGLAYRMAVVIAPGVPDFSVMSGGANLNSSGATPKFTVTQTGLVGAGTESPTAVVTITNKTPTTPSFSIYASNNPTPVLTVGSNGNTTLQGLDVYTTLETFGNVMVSSNLWVTGALSAPSLSVVNFFVNTLTLTNAMGSNQVRLGYHQLTNIIRRQTIYADAGSMISNITGGATFSTEETSSPTNRMFDSYVFDGAVTNSVQVKLAMPLNWDLSTVKVKLWTFSTNNLAAKTNVWAISAAAIKTISVITNIDWGTELTITNTVSSAGGQALQTPATPALTVGNTPASAGNLVWFRIRRLPGHVDDSDAGVQKLMGAWIQYGETMSEVASW